MEIYTTVFFSMALTDNLLNQSFLTVKVWKGTSTKTLELMKPLRTINKLPPDLVWSSSFLISDKYLFPLALTLQHMQSGCEFAA